MITPEQNQLVSQVITDAQAVIEDFDTEPAEDRLDDSRQALEDELARLNQLVEKLEARAAWEPLVNRLEALAAKLEIVKENL